MDLPSGDSWDTAPVSQCGRGDREVRAHDKEQGRDSHRTTSRRGQSVEDAGAIRPGCEVSLVMREIMTGVSVSARVIPCDRSVCECSCYSL